MLFSVKCFNFWEKYHISGKFWYFRKNFLFRLLKWYIDLPPPVAKKNKFKCPFFSKSAPQSLPPPPPQLLEASYAPVRYTVNIIWYNPVSSKAEPSTSLIPSIEELVLRKGSAAVIPWDNQGAIIFILTYCWC